MIRRTAADGFGVCEQFAKLPEGFAKVAVMTSNFLRGSHASGKMCCTHEGPSATGAHGDAVMSDVTHGRTAIKGPEMWT